MVAFLRGMTSMGCVIAAVFFLRFWRQSLDRLFLFFALAFLLLAAEYFVLGVVSFASEWTPYVFTVRLVAFGLIIVAIAEKNRR